jgi:hypothetical protein
MLVLLVVVAVDVGGEVVVAIVAILGNVSVVDVHGGRTIVATLWSGFRGRRGLTMRRVPLSLTPCV